MRNQKLCGSLCNILLPFAAFALLVACTPTQGPISPTRVVITRETAVSPTPTISPLDTLITQLEQTGAVVVNEGEEPQGLFEGATGLVRLTVNGAVVRVFTFPTLAARQYISGALSPDGSQLTFTLGDSVTEVFMEWESFPVFWALDTLLINYVGEDTAVIDLLSTALGTPIANGFRPYPTPTPEVIFLTPTPPPLPTPTPVAVTDPPIFSGGNVRLQGWSPDGRFLAYFEYTQEQLDATEYPGSAEGTFTLYDTTSGAKCQRYPLSGMYSHEGDTTGQRFIWLPDGSFFIITMDSQVIQADVPCGSDVDLTAVFPQKLIRIESLSPDQTRLLLKAESGYLLYDWQTQSITPIAEVPPDAFNNLVWSPDGAYIGVTLAGNYTGDRNPIGGSRVVDAATGQIIARHDWEPANALDGTFGGPEWISPTEFVVTLSLDQGPFFMNVEGEIRPLLPLFGLEFVRDQVNAVADTYVDPASGAYHILTDFGWFGSSYPPQVYHSDIDSVEVLDLTGLQLTPDGLLFYSEGYLARPITAVGAPFYSIDTPCLAALYTPPSPIFVRATGNPTDVELYAMPECRYLETVQIPPLPDGRYAGGWVSPDGRWLVLFATHSIGYIPVLYVIPIAFP